HLELDVDDRGAAQMPGDAVNGGGPDTAKNRIREERLDRMGRVDVDRRDVDPVAAETVQPVTHDAENVRRLFAHRVRRAVAVAHELDGAAPGPSLPPRTRD